MIPVTTPRPLGLAGLLPVPLHACGVYRPELPAAGGPVPPVVTFVMARKQSLRRTVRGTWLQPAYACGRRTRGTSPGEWR